MRKIFATIYLLYAAIIFLALMLVVCPLIVMATAVFAKHTGKRIAFVFLRIWALLFSTLAFFWLRSSGRNKVDRSKAYIYTGNHSSYLDAVAVAYCIPQVFSPLGKIEMARIPVFGWIYSRVVIMIDRSSKESRAESVSRLKTDIDHGISILIFPEGTMNQEDTDLAPFYDGAFRIAIETQTPILPFVIINSKQLLPRRSPLLVKPGIITTVFGEPIPVTGLAADDIERLKNEVREAMLKLLHEFRAFKK